MHLFQKDWLSSEGAVLMTLEVLFLFWNLLVLKNCENVCLNILLILIQIIDKPPNFSEVVLTHETSSFLCAKSFQCPTLCDVMDRSPPGSSVLGILQARILEWVAMPSSRGFSRPRNWTRVSYVSSLAGRFFTTSAAWEGIFRSSLIT